MDQIVDFLDELVHGPCGSATHAQYTMYVEAEARRHLERIANKNLDAAGAYGRTITRWWEGFYTNHVKPTVSETAKMTPHEITLIISNGSRRG